MESAEVSPCQVLPPLNFSPAVTEIIGAEISKLLSKCVIVNTTREPNDYVSDLSQSKMHLALPLSVVVLCQLT